MHLAWLIFLQSDEAWVGCTWQRKHPIRIYLDKWKMRNATWRTVVRGAFHQLPPPHQISSPGPPFTSRLLLWKMCLIRTLFLSEPTSCRICNVHLCHTHTRASHCSLSTPRVSCKVSYMGLKGPIFYYLLFILFIFFGDRRSTYQHQSIVGSLPPDKFFCQVERRFHSREWNIQPLPWDLGISPPSSSSLGLSRTMKGPFTWGPKSHSCQQVPTWGKVPVFKLQKIIRRIFYAFF